MNAIKVQHVTKQYKNGVKALNGLNLKVDRGEIFSLLGQNGSGKSSLINILTTYLPKTSGAITILEKDIDQDPCSIRKQIACVAQRTSIDTHLSMEENMLFQARLYKVNGDTAKKRMNDLISCFELEHYRKHPVASFSGGVKRRLDIAMNMMSHPKILFLDEPTVGMDIQSRMAMWKMMKKIRDDFGVTIFLTTHYLEEADQLSNTICLMKDGREIVQASPHELRQYMHQDIVRIGFAKIEQAKACATQLRKFKPVITEEHFVIVGANNSQEELRTVNSWLLEHNIPFTGIEIGQPSLDEVFIHLTKDGEEVSR
ncbi:ABC transporter ATP-binding protein [Bacillus sp. CLL-7-23]|uniref:ABC transporter ATP-binding protein n=1 Tax=Bacillus changyiensis TaxID=3004103 RepID=A0ABT4X2N1_9BACI|nr:ABC transporter ATP-binding protein [Bacillus changyiensis]MDA7026531.1 ABC transporter ATP-binding protein [Bacillus changyiensis]